MFEAITIYNLYVFANPARIKIWRPWDCFTKHTYLTFNVKDQKKLQYLNLDLFNLGKP